MTNAFNAENGNFNIRFSTSKDIRKKKRQRTRTCRIEELESREMLSVTFGEFEQISSQYSDLYLNNYADYNIIEVANLTDSALRQAITDAGSTVQDDLIVVRTTATQNKITLEGSALSIGIDYNTMGSVTIVSLGSDPLTIDANSQSQVFSIAIDSFVALAGLTITGGNSSGNGGGIYNEGWLRLTESQVKDNFSVNSSFGDAGGIYNTGSLDITNSSITGNKALYNGGGIYSANGYVWIQCSIIAGNEAANGHGGGVFSDGNGYLDISSSLVVGNRTGYGSGGGIYSWGTTNLTNVTLTGNWVSDGSGGGIYNHDGYTTILNSIIADNKVQGNVNNIYTHGDSVTYTELYHSLVDNTSIIGGKAADDYGGNLLDAVPQFVSYTSGSTWSKSQWEAWDLRLVAGSQGIDAGDNDYAYDSYDLDGNARIVNGIVDMGAYEYQGTGTSTQLAVPTGVTAVSAGATSVTVTWNSVANASGYMVWYSTDSNFSSGEPVNSSTQSATIGGLMTGVTYYFRIMAVGSGEYTNSEFSSTVSAVPTESSTQLAAPTGLHSTFIGETSVSLAWDAVEGAIGYEVGYYTYEWDQWSYWDSYDTFLTIDGLNPNTEYLFDVHAWNNGSSSEWSGIIYETTLDSTGLSEPQNFRFTGQTGYSVSLAWDAVEGAEYYYLEYTDGWGDWYGAYAYDTYVTIDGLNPNTWYDFYVYACNEEMWSDGAYINVSTLAGELTAPANFSVNVVEARSISFQWDIVDNAYGYEMQYREAGQNNWQSLGLSYWLEGLTYYGQVGGLAPNTTYEFQVRAYDYNYTYSDWSAIASATTLDGVSYAPQNLTVTNTTAYTVSLQWDPVQDVNRRDYYVEYRIAGDENWQWAWGRWTGISSMFFQSRPKAGIYIDADTTYEFRVGVYNQEVGDTDWSNPVAATTLPTVDNYNANDLQKVESQGLQEYAFWDRVGDEMRLTGMSIYEDWQGVSLDLANCTALRYLYVWQGEWYEGEEEWDWYVINGPLASLNLTGCTALQELEIEGTSLTSLNLTGYSSLTSVWVGSNKLESLNVSNLTSLTELYIGGEFGGEPNLTSLNITGCTALEYLDIWGTALTSLDLTGFSSLLSLGIGGEDWEGEGAPTERSPLSSLILTGCTALEGLYIYNTSLTSFTLPALPELRWLDFYENTLLTSLNVSQLTALEYMWIDNNQLRFSTLTLPPDWSGDIWGIETMQIFATLQPSGTINLSSENIDGATTYTWNNVLTGEQLVSGTHYTETNGVFTFSSAVNNVRLMCEMTNPNFSEMRVWTTEVTIGTVVDDAPGSSMSTARDVSFTGGVFSTEQTLREYGVHMYRFYVAPGDVGKEFTFETSQPDDKESFDTYLRLFNASGTQVEYDDDGGYGYYSLLNWTPTAAGYYYLGVSGYGTGYDPTQETPGSGLPINAYALQIVSGSVADSAPAAPTNFRSTDKTTTSVTLAWNASIGADYYEVWYSANGGSWWAWGVDGETTLTITGLESNTEYEFMIIAANSFGWSPWSTTVSEKTLASSSTLGVPANVHSTAQTATSITLAWDAVSGATGYDIQYRQSNSSHWNMLVRDTNSNSLSMVIEGLNPGTLYDIQVRAFDGTSTSAWSTSQFVWTMTDTSTLPGDTLNTATQVAFVNDSYSATHRIGDGAQGNRDRHMYRVELETGREYTFATSQPQGRDSFDTYIRLFDANGNELLANDDFGWTLYSSLTFTATTSGTYYLGVSHWRNSDYNPQVSGSGTDGNTGDYTLTVTQSALAGDVPGDTLNTATAVTFNNDSYSATHRIGDGPQGNKDVHMYRVSLDAGREYTFATSQPPGRASFDTYIRLFDANGNELLANDDFGWTLYSSLTFTATTSGTYYLGVSHWRNSDYNPQVSGSGAEGSTGDYTLTVTRTAVSLTPGSSIATAPLIPFVNNTYSATHRISNGQDFHMFAIEVTEADIERDVALTFTTSRPAGSPTFDTLLRLFDADGNQLAYNDDSGSIYSSLSYEQWLMGAGTYYIGVSSNVNRYYDPNNASSGEGAVTGDYTLTVVRNLYTEPLDVPGNVMASAQSTTAATISWNTVSNASGYTIQYATNAAFTTNVRTHVVLGGSARFGNVTGLTSGTTYYFRVLANGVDVYSDSEYSQSVNVTLEVPPTPATPRGLNASSIQQNSAQVSWNVVADLATGYELRYKTREGNSWESHSISSTSQVISGLTSNTTYDIQVRSVDSRSGMVSHWESITITTLADQTAPARPANFSVSNVAGTGLTLTWSPQNGLTGYTLQYWASNSSQTSSTTVSLGATATSYNVTGLTAGTSYNFRLTATNPSGTSSAAALDNIQTVGLGTNYAVLFAGGYNAPNNHIRYYDAIKDLYNVLVTSYGLARENIYVIYADGTDPGVDLSNGQNSDMTYAAGSQVWTANYANLDAAFTSIGNQMTANDHLLFYTFDHGGGSLVQTSVGEETLTGWGTEISGRNVANAVAKIQEGHVTMVFTQCFAGGVLAEIIDPSTGAAKIATNAKLYGMAATNHYEYSWGDGFARAFINAIDPMRGGQVSTTEAFAYAKANNPFTRLTTYGNNEGVFTNYYEHPWGAGESFSIFVSASANSYDSNFRNVGGGNNPLILTNNRSSTTDALEYVKDESIFLNFTFANPLGQTVSVSVTVLGDSLAQPIQLDRANVQTVEIAPGVWKLDGNLDIGTLGSGYHTVSVQLFVNGTPTTLEREIMVQEHSFDVGDTLLNAEVIDKRLEAAASALASGAIGDGKLGGLDVDVFQYVVTAADVGKTLVFSTIADAMSTMPVDTYVRLFNAAGTLVASSTYAAVGGISSLFYNITDVDMAGVYYIAVSALTNTNYDITRAGSGAEGNIGHYQLSGHIAETKADLSMTYDRSWIDDIVITEENGTVNVSYKFANIGYLPAAAGVVYTIKIEGPNGYSQSQTFTTGSPIAVGGFYQGNVEWGRLAAGEYTITIELDTTNVLSELTTDNNKLVRAFTVGSPAVASAATPNKDNIQVVQTGTTEVTVSWAPVWNASGYTVQYRAWDGAAGEGVWGAWTTFKVAGGADVVTEETFLKITGLTPDTKYEFRVVAVGGSVAGVKYGNSTASEVSEKQTITLEVLPAGAVAGKFKAATVKTEQKHNSVTLTLNTNKDALTNVHYYVVKCTSHPSLGTFMVVATGANQKFEIKGLQANQSYKFEIQVIGANGGYLNKPAKVTAKTAKGTNLAAPKKIARGSGLNSVTLDFARATGIPASATHIMIEVHQTSGAKGYKFTEMVAIADIGGINGRYVVNGLEPNGVKYQFRVSFVDANGDISAFAKVSGATVKLNRDGQFPAPKSVKLASTNTTTLTLTLAPSPVGEVPVLPTGATFEGEGLAALYRDGFLVLGGYRVGAWNSKTQLGAFPEADVEIEKIVIGEVLNNGRVTATITVSGLGRGDKVDLGVQAVTEDGKHTSAVAKASTKMK